MPTFDAIGALKQIRELLFNTQPAPAPAPVPAPAPAPVQFTDYTLADGSTVVSIDNLAVGGKVTIAGAPAADGEICLQDGTCVTIAGGLITAVTPPAPAEPAPANPVQMSNEEILKKVDAFADAPSVSSKDISLILKALCERVFEWDLRKIKDAQALEVITTNFSTVQKASQDLLTVVEHMAAEGITEPAEVDKDWNEMTPLERFRAVKK